MKVHAFIFSLVISGVHGLVVVNDPVPSATFDLWTEFVPEDQYRSTTEDEHQRTSENLPPGFLDLVNNEVASNFPNLSSVTDFRARLEAIMSAGKVDPNSADIKVSGLGWTGGYASRILMLFNEMVIALYFQKSVAICTGTFMYKVYTQYYKVPESMPFFTDWRRKWGKDNWGMDFTKQCNDKLLYVARDNFSPWLMKRDFELISNMKRFLYQSLMTLKPEVENEITSRLDARGFQKNTKYLGVHIRHGDKKGEMESGLLTTEAYAQAIQKELNSTGITSIFVASDDPNAGKVLKSMLNPDVKIDQQFSQSSRGRSYGDRESVLEYLTDIQALQQADVFIGTQSSNTGRIVYYGRSADKKSVSLDGEWSICPYVNSDCMRH